jgi:hypothetical protein
MVLLTMLVLNILAQTAHSFQFPGARQSSGFTIRAVAGKRPGPCQKQLLQSADKHDAHCTKHKLRFDVKQASADDIKDLAWVVADVFLNEWKGPLGRQVTLIQRQRMWMNVFLSMLCRVILASFFLGLEIAEEASRSGKSIDQVEKESQRRRHAPDTLDAPHGESDRASGESDSGRPLISPAAAHSLLLAVVYHADGTQIVAGVIEVVNMHTHALTHTNTHKHMDNYTHLLSLSHPPLPMPPLPIPPSLPPSLPLPLGSSLLAPSQIIHLITGKLQTISTAVKPSGQASVHQ